MKKLVKGIFITAIAGSLLLSSSIVSFAAWQQSTDGRWWNTDSSERGYSVGWTEIDGTWYYFDENGWMLSDTTTPDGFFVGSDGSWIQQESKKTAYIKEPADAVAFCNEIFGTRDDNLGADCYYSYKDTVEYEGKNYYVMEFRVFFDGAQKSSYWSHLGVAEDKSVVYQCSWPAAGQTFADTFDKQVWPK